MSDQDHDRPDDRAGSDGLSAALERLVGVPRLLVAIDFDGTVAHLNPDPGSVRPLPGVSSALEDLLAVRDTRVAVLSGRARADLLRLSGAPAGVALVGSHGAEFDALDGPSDTPRTPPLLDRTATALLDQLISDCQALASRVPGSLLEIKPASVAVHVRASERAAGAELLEAVASGPARLPGVHVSPGKFLLELGVVRLDKGAALLRLREEHAADAVFFAGDDTTDEAGFAVLRPGDVGVKVGLGPSAAAYRVADPEAAVILLRTMADLRRRSVPTP